MAKRVICNLLLLVRLRQGAPRFEVAPRRIRVKDLMGLKHGFSLQDVVSTLQLNLDAHYIWLGSIVEITRDCHFRNRGSIPRRVATWL